MSMGTTMWRICQGKQRYDEAAAKERAARHNATRRRRESRLQAYRCDCCAYWHLGGHHRSTNELRRGGV